jgi:Uma2 family endonuclease
MVATELNLADLLPATFTAPGLSEKDFFALCQKFPDAILEYTPDGTVIIMPPTDPDSGDRVAEVVQQLRNWAQALKRPRVTGPDTGFFFPDGGRRAPDAAWFDLARWRTVQASNSELRVPVFAPEFVIEVRSPDDRMRELREKMQEFISNGVQLGWLIDPFDRTVTIYRPGRIPEVLTDPSTVSGEGPVAGFVLNLQDIFTA